MKHTYFSLLILAIGLLGGAYLVYSKMNMSVVENNTVVSTTPEVVYTLEEVSQHTTKDDCWQVINEVVYDFTPYVASGDHPGGKAMVKDCGTDATFRYENDPKHSEYAESLLPEYAIGTLEASDSGELK
jgi:cytochrome b involved in lipid metabolism